MQIPGFLSDIQAIEHDAALRDQANFAARAAAIDDIDFRIIGHIDILLQKPGNDEQLLMLRQRAQLLIDELEKIDAHLFEQLRMTIRAHSYDPTSFKDMVTSYAPLHHDHANDPYYDDLDTFINGLLCDAAIPLPAIEPKPGMVFYQKTPARVIFQLAEQARMGAGDVFCDIGSGLGQVCMLMALLSSAQIRGIEYDPAYCNYAATCAANLNLPTIEFINADALIVDHSKTTVFFLYTPFTGTMLTDMLNILHQRSQATPIRIFSYGPCSARVAQDGWLWCVNGDGMDINSLWEFRSVGHV